MPVALSTHVSPEPPAAAAPALDYAPPRRSLPRLLRRLAVTLLLLAVAAAWPLCAASYEHVFASLNWILGRTSTEVICTIICNHTGFGMTVFVKRYKWDDGQTRYRATLMKNDLTRRPRGTLQWDRPNRGWGITPVIHLFPYFRSTQKPDFQFTGGGLKAGRWSTGPVRMEPWKLRGSATASETWLVLPTWLLALLSCAAGTLLLLGVARQCAACLRGAARDRGARALSAHP